MQLHESNTACLNEPLAVGCSPPNIIITCQFFKIACAVIWLNALAPRQAET